MSLHLPRNSHLALIAVVSALLILKATKRAPKKPLHFNDFRDLASRVDTHGVAGQELFESEYDIIIIGGGGVSLSTLSAPERLKPPVGTAGCVLAARLSEEPSLRVLVIESGERYFTSRSA
jgi:hypothetical protein